MNSGFKTPRTLSREKMTPASSTESLAKRTRDPVQVFCRIRPLKEETDESCVKLVSATTLTLTSPQDARVARRDVNYIFRHIFTSYSSQKELFDHVALPLLDDLMGGKNGLLFTYGVTGSGKTFTLTGDQTNPGIMPRCIDTIFNTIEERQTPKFLIKSDRMNGFELQTESDACEDRFQELKTLNRRAKVTKRNGDKPLYANDGTKTSCVNEDALYAVFISYIEIYNNTVYDLLDESTGKVLQAKIIREDSQKNMYVNAVVEMEVKSGNEAFELFNLGQKRKRMAHTALNAESSRSHSIFNIRVVQLEKLKTGQGQPLIPDKNYVKVAQLSLVDLAGSERTSRTQNTGMRLKEASSINNSLMSLRNCLEILRENQLNGTNRLVPYRDSRLTLLFKNYFEGEGQVKMIVCVNPSILDYEENLQVLKFAEMTQDVKTTRPESRYTPFRTKTPKTPKSALFPQTPTSIKKVKKPVSFTLPKVPFVTLNSGDQTRSKESIQQVIKILRMRKQKSSSLVQSIAGKENHFRKRLIEINDANLINQSELRSQKTLLKKEKQKTQNLEVKLLDLESINESIALKNEELQDIIRTLHNTIDEKDLKISQNYLEREKSKQKLAIQAEKINEELHDKLRKQRAHLQAAMQAKEAKIKKAQEILESDVICETISEPERRPYEPQQTPTHSVTLKDSTHRRNIVVSSSRRRSRSAGEVWLEHNSVKPVPLGTVLQPSIKKRKSLTKLSKAEDVTNPKQNKYCLIAQQADTDGEVETKVYKGDIVPTCGGGAQVIFNDVECLRQESPTSPRT